MTTSMLVADSADARIFQSKTGKDWTLIREMSHPQSRVRPSEVGPDKPGRVRQSTGQRSAMETPTPHKKKEAQKFARELAEFLEREIASGAVDRLVLVTPPEFLGILRAELPPAVLARVIDTIEKDYVHLDMATLKERVQKELRVQ
jgi:protein required for attachment to host cells